MNQFKLWFTSDQETELYKTEYVPEIGDGSIYSIRGNYSGDFKGYGTFQWSLAVQALSIMVLRYAAASVTGELQDSALEGEKGSLASSLDYAISKQPVWILDMFGVLPSGEPRIKRLIKRVNPERKRPGPVRLSVNTTVLPPKNIEVYVENHRIVDSEELKDIALKIEREVIGRIQSGNAQIRNKTASSKYVYVNDAFSQRSRGVKKEVKGFERANPFEDEVSRGVYAQEGDTSDLNPYLTKELISSQILTADILNNYYPDIIKNRYPLYFQYLKQQLETELVPEPFHKPQWKKFLSKAYFNEVYTMLSITDIFNPTRYNNLRRESINNPSFIKYAPHVQNIVSDVDLELMAANRLGVFSDEDLIRQHLCKPEPIRVVLSPANAASLAILKYLKYMKGYNIEVDYKYAHSVEITKNALNRQFVQIPDVCSISIAGAAVLLNKLDSIEFEPFMVMPKISHAVIAPKESDPSYQRGEYLILNSDVPSTSLFYFEDLELNGEISRKNITVRNCEPDEITLVMREGNPEMRAIIAFPFYTFNYFANGSVILNDPSSQTASKLSLFFGHKTFMEDKEHSKFFNIAVRDAWIELKSAKSTLDMVINLILEDREYLNFLKRCVGIYNFANEL
jgi:hypothetical protein